MPRTVPLIAGILLLGACGGARLLVRRALRINARTRHRVAIFGASDVGAGLAAAMAHDRASTIVAFFDDAPQLAGGSLRGIRIHPSSAFDAVLETTGFDSLLVALGPASRVACRAALEHAAACGVRVLSVPTLAEIKDGRVNVDALRPLAIEDLLGRAPVPPRHDLLTAGVTGKCVMVTGAGGSIGSELCRQVLSLGPRALVMVDNGEFNLFQIDSELSAYASSLAPGSARPVTPSITRPPTSMSRSWRTTSPRAPRSTCWAPCAWPRPPCATACPAWCSSRPTRPCVPPA
jgi:FlaA1/EpsC-like NDP-sugar epimerase